MQLSKELKVGAVVVAALALFYYGYSFLKGSRLFETGYSLYANYTDINGLSIDNPVMMKGFKIGKVGSLELNNTTGQILVEIHINEDETVIPKNTKAIISDDGLLGGKAIRLDLGNSVEGLADGDTIKGLMEKGMMAGIEPLTKSANDVVSSADSVMVLIQKLLNKQNRDVIDSSLINLNATLKNMNSASSDLESLIATEKVRLSNIITNLNQMSENLNQFSDSLNDLEIKKTITEANLALNNVNGMLAKIDSGEGTVGQLLNNDTLYMNLQSASENLDKLLIDLEKNPKRYVHFSVFGRKDKKGGGK